MNENMKIIPITNLSNNIDDNNNVLILSSSFESRCLTISKELKNKNFEKVIVVENKKGSELISKNGTELAVSFSNSTLLKIDFDDQIAFAHQLVKEICELQNEEINVLIDITTFTHETLLVCLKTLYCNSIINKITCLYLNASEYCKNKPVEQKWLSKGAKGVHPIFRFSGMLYPSLETHLIIIVGYEYERAFEVISQIEPNSLTLIYGTTEDAITEKDKSANQHYLYLLKEMAFEYQNIESCIINCYDPQKTSKALSEIYSQYSDKNIIVIPMNNKMSTAGVFLSTIDNEDIQVCYAPAVIYNEDNYSEPGNDCYILNLK